jgi:ABC-type branched-subunit amino acid transport system ATPase component
MTPQSDLRVDNMTVRFGGLTAVNAVTLEAKAGAVTGLIGPNGAGKTTIFNACAGAVKASAGSTWLGEVRLDHHGVARRASLGLGRTFQRMELFNSMTVEENVALGPETMFSSRRPWGQLWCSRRDGADVAERSRVAMQLCGISALATRTVGDMPTGQRRLVELARAIATPFKFLMLDEPSSGLDVVETEKFGDILQKFVSETGVGVLLVEHDIALVSSVCSYIYVLEFGNLISSGAAAETLASDAVRSAYLGTDSVYSEAEQSNRTEVASHA